MNAQLRADQYGPLFLYGDSGEALAPPRYVSSIEEMAGEALNGKDKGPLPMELCSQMNGFRLASFFARKPEIGAKLIELGWNPCVMATELRDEISKKVFGRIEEALYVLAYSGAKCGLHSVPATMTAIWDWAELDPDNVIMNTAHHVESYYWNSQANDFAARTRLSRAQNFASHCGQGVVMESNVHVLNITKISLGFLVYGTPLFAYGPREESERLDIAKQMNDLGWEREDVKFMFSLEGETGLYGPSIALIEISNLIRLALRKGVEGKVIRKMAELFERDKDAGVLFHHFQMAHQAKRFDSDFFLNHELNY